MTLYVLGMLCQIEKVTRLLESVRFVIYILQVCVGVCFDWYFDNYNIGLYSSLKMLNDRAM